MTFTARRLATLIGSSSALSRPVIAGVAITGFALSFRYAALSPESSLLWDLAAGTMSGLVTVMLLTGARLLRIHRGWSEPRVGFVLVSFSLTSILRSTLTSLLVDPSLNTQALDPNPGVRIVASLTITIVIALILAASAELARERAAATSILLAEQRRLRSLAESMDAELIRVESELRGRALNLLAPTIEEIRELIQDEISETAAQQVSRRIVDVVNDVVRPASRALAISPQIELDELDDTGDRSQRILADRMDVTRAIRPVWLLLLSWAILIPGPLFLGANPRVMVTWFGLTVLFALFLVGLKTLWPRRLRVMPVPLGLGVLLLLYVVTNVGFQIFLSRWDSHVRGSAAWISSNELAVLLRVALAMLVSVLATLNVHGEQIRANLISTNSQLQALIARIRRETWLLHRSMSLTVHGTVQSALVSTAMRLSSPNRSPATVADARRRLEEALVAISADQGTEGTVIQALENLQGLWKSVVSITFRITATAEIALSQDPGLRQCVVEICREATSNAIRHGHATSVEMHIDVEGNLIEIHVVDNGGGTESTAIPGLGSSMLDDTCLRWSLSRTPNGGSELVAVLI